MAVIVEQAVVQAGGAAMTDQAIAAVAGRAGVAADAGAKSDQDRLTLIGVMLVEALRSAPAYLVIRQNLVIADFIDLLRSAATQSRNAGIIIFAVWVLQINLKNSII
jgi:hypothetical protein